MIYVAGKIRSLGSDAQVQELTAADVEQVGSWSVAGFDHIDPARSDKVGSARQLYNFDALKDQQY